MNRAVRKWQLRGLAAAFEAWYGHHLDVLEEKEEKLRRESEKPEPKKPARRKRAPAATSPPSRAGSRT